MKFGRAVSGCGKVVLVGGVPRFNVVEFGGCPRPFWGQVSMAANHELRGGYYVYHLRQCYPAKLWRAWFYLSMIEAYGSMECIAALGARWAMEG